MSAAKAKLSYEQKKSRVMYFMLLFILSASHVSAFSPPHSGRTELCHHAPIHRPHPLFLTPDGENYDDDEEEEEIDVSDQDWRAFRAKLVMGTQSPPIDEGDLDGIGAIYAEARDETIKTQLKGMTPLDPSQWAYDSGNVIEQGAVILGGVEQKFGFGLRQQYFHKAAILVLDHEESTFTKGIILNRPTDLTLDDDINPGVKWRVWFGGDVQGLDSSNPDIVCLHSLKIERAQKASVTVMNDIQWTTFDNAKLLVKAGVAQPTDFWVFAGYAGWGPGQLMGELERKSWYMVATDSQTLLKELARLGEGADPRDAGLDTWTLLMNMIGNGETAEEYTGDFDDLMLKEWALKNLLSSEAGGGAGEKRRAPEGVASTQELLRSDPVDQLIQRASAACRGEDVTEGSLVRAAPVQRSPFLLDDQELHKSVILIIKDDENLTIGVILNRPAAKAIDILIQEKDTGDSKKVSLALRYGGQYTVKGGESLLWLHCSPVLQAAEVGSPVGLRKDGIWKCTAQDVVNAIGKGLATAEEFLVVAGVCVWTKGEKGLARGMLGEIRSGKFELVPHSRFGAVFKTLRKQDVLTNVNMMKNLAIGAEAWALGITNGAEKKSDEATLPPIGGLGEGFDEEDDTLVFKSDVKVSKLADDALQSWIAAFLLGSPTLGA